MEQFNKPTQLNGRQLLAELASANIKVNDDPTVDGEGVLLLDIAKGDIEKAAAIIASHIGVDDVDDLLSKKQEIFEKLGLTADEAKLLI
jgi:hypothetical protein